MSLLKAFLESKINVNEYKKPLVIIGGPTASGKSKLGVELAKIIGGQIISADSMQVYRGMDIGTAKVTESEMDGIKHYGIDILDPSEAFNVTVFQSMAEQAMEKIYEDGDIPIVVGGTGFYIQALLYGIEFNEAEGDGKLRAELQEIADTYGAEHLHNMLKECDPLAAELIHPNNIKRVIRAIEYNRLTGELISEHNAAQMTNDAKYNYAYFALTDDREVLYERIDRRVDKMIDDGLVEEVRKLLDQGLTRDMVSMQGIGYKEIIAYLEGECSLDDAIYSIKKGSRNYAKRQLTWLRREKEVEWIDRTKYDTIEKMLEYMMKIIDFKNFKI